MSSYKYEETSVELFYDEIIEVVQSFSGDIHLPPPSGRERTQHVCSQLNWGQTRLSDLLKMHFHLKPREREEREREREASSL